MTTRLTQNRAETNLGGGKFLATSRIDITSVKTSVRRTGAAARELNVVKGGPETLSFWTGRGWTFTQHPVGSEDCKKKTAAQFLMEHNLKKSRCQSLWKVWSFTMLSTRKKSPTKLRKIHVSQDGTSVELKGCFVESDPPQVSLATIQRTAQDTDGFWTQPIPFKGSELGHFGNASPRRNHTVFKHFNQLSFLESYLSLKGFATKNVPIILVPFKHPRIKIGWLSDGVDSKSWLINGRHHLDPFKIGWL